MTPQRKAQVWRWIGVFLSFGVGLIFWGVVIYWGGAMTDRELLELAAKAAEIDVIRSRLDDPACRDFLIKDSARNQMQKLGPWNPLTDDGDALRLAVKLRMAIEIDDEFEPVPQTANACASGIPETGAKWCCELLNDDPNAAMRRAIVLAAAEIGKHMP